MWKTSFALGAVRSVAEKFGALRQTLREEQSVETRALVVQNSKQIEHAKSVLFGKLGTYQLGGTAYSGQGYQQGRDFGNTLDVRPGIGAGGERLSLT